MDISGWAQDPNALAEFLEEANLARIATLDEAGRPHVVPAWHWWDGRQFWIGSDGADRKVAHLRRDPICGIEIDADLRRKRGIFANASARIIDGSDGRREYVRITTEQVRRYQPGRPPHHTAEQYASKGEPVVIVISPERMISWGR
ncbi:MAG TPA: pyridoxamine 5'-phosphate oxidase family protein [Candidatus Saccharimonadales bacterium]|nr:pyridoxamine 5'-phosphate oxidase family protein [Candidatus Saccharimonadales bacterium]